MNVDWIEVNRDSRSFSVSRDAITKRFSFIVKSEDFIRYADQQTLPGGLGSKFVLDDDIMQAEVIPFFWSVAPLTYRFVLGNGAYDYVMLYASSLEGEQINWSTWKIDVTYDVPSDNGQSRGAGGGSTGPSNNEANSQEFTQLSFDATVDLENSQVGTLIEAQNRIGNANPVSYTPGKIYIIGETDDSIKGADFPVRKFSFEITQYMPPTKLTYAYVRRLSKLTTALNKKTFFGFPPLSVCCMGAGASGHIYQNVPVTLRFEVKPNVKLMNTLPTFAVSAPLNESYITFPDGKRVVNTTNQFDQMRDSDFPDTATTFYSALGLEPALPPGVHSGWAQIDYTYRQVIDAAGKTKLRIPDTRKIFMPPRMLVIDYVEFLL